MFYLWLEVSMFFFIALEFVHEIPWDQVAGLLFMVVMLVGWWFLVVHYANQTRK